MQEDLNWYAIYTRHQHEKAIAQVLGRKGLEVFLPLRAIRSQWQDRIQRIEKPLFPCYVFVNMEIRERLKVLQTPGIHWLVGNSLGPLAIPQEEIDSIRRVLHAGLLVDSFPFLNVGDRVRVRGGALDGVEGILLCKKKNDRLILSINLLQKSVSIEIDGYQVERIGPSRTVPTAATVTLRAGGLQ